MRDSFILAFEKYVQDNTILIVGDLGYGVVDSFQKKYPSQFINVGVAEQNMVGVAAGLALAGKKVFAYSIGNFSTLRPLEQIRNGIAYHNLNVTIVSVGGGLAYGPLGISHHATEDLAILRAIPNMTVLAPADKLETFELTKYILLNDCGPVYFRLGPALRETLHTEDSIKTLKIGKGLPVIENCNDRLAIFSTGGLMDVAYDVHMMLHEINISSSIISIHTLKPFDEDIIRKVFRSYEYIVSMEEHSCIGGLRSCILEALEGVSAIDFEKYFSFALPSVFISEVGSQNYLRNLYGISPEKIFKKLSRAIK